MRNILLTAARRAAEGLGYTFYTGTAASVAGRIDSFPAAWLAPLKLVSAKGDKERTHIYRANMCMMMEPGYPDAVPAEEVLRLLENDAMEICRLIREEENVQRTFNVKCTPDQKPFTVRGESGVTVEFDTELFCCL